MSGAVLLLAVVLLVPLVLLRTVKLVRRRAPLPGGLLPPVGSPTELEASALLTALRRRGAVAAITVIVIVTAAVAVQTWWPAGVGLPILLAPAAALLGLGGVYALWPLPEDPAGARTPVSSSTHADTATRRARLFGPSWGYALPALLMSGTVLAALAGGLLATTDESGRSREFPYIVEAVPGAQDAGLAAGATGPFPGWYYGAPVIGILVLSALLLGWALHRNARRPRLRGEGLVAFDNSVRTCVAFVVSAGASALAALQLALLCVMAGQAVIIAAQNIPGGAGIDGAAMPSTVDGPTWWMGLGLMALALLLLVVAAALGATFLAWILGNRRTTADGASHLRLGDVR